MYKAQRGFTLMEVMVVLVIVGLLLSMVNLSSGDRAAQSETEQFAYRIQAAFGQYREEAVFQNLDLGVAWMPDEFQLLTYQDVFSQEFGTGLTVEERDILIKNPWQPFGGNLAPSISIPEEVHVVLSIEGSEVNLDDLLDEDVGVRPALLFLSSDEYTPFIIELTHDADDGFIIQLVGDGLNPVTMSMERTDV